jgi:hypothetical protein
LRLLPQAKADAAGLASGAVLRRAGDGLLGSCLRELTLRLRRGGQRFSRLAAVRGGVNGLMGEVLEDHIRFHLTDGSKERIAPELAEDLIDLVRAYLK